MTQSYKGISKIALGTVQFGLAYGIANKTGQVPRSNAKDILQLAAFEGIDLLDTAAAYGESENCLGEVGTKGFKLVTKLSAVPNNCSDVSEWIKREVNNSLSQLGVKSVYGLLLHQPMQLLNTFGDTLYRSLQQLKETGTVHKIGVSIYSPNELEKLLPHYHFDLVQAPFNLMDRRLQKSGWLQKLKKDGVEIHTRSTFLQGLLLMSQADIPEQFSPWEKLFTTWHKWLSLHQMSAVQACLTSSLSIPEIDRVIVGVDSVNQLEQIVDMASCNPSIDYPDIHSDSEDLINPSHWPSL